MTATQTASPADDVPRGAALIVAAFALVAATSALGKGVGVPAATIVCCQRVVSLLLSNIASLSIAIVACLWLRDRAAARTIASLLVGFALILKPGPAMLRDPAAPLAIGAAVCSAIALASVNRLSSLVAAPFVPVNRRAPTPRQRQFRAGIGACQAASQLLILRAYRFAPPGWIAAFDYSAVVFSGVIGWLVWRDRPDALAVAGVGLVAVGGIVAARRPSSHAHGHVGWIGHLNARSLHRHHRKLAA